MELPEYMRQADDNYYSYSGSYRRLALLGTIQNGAYKTYHIATGNPLYKSRTRKKTGRVDFFSLNENSWVFSPTNNAGLASEINGLFFESDAAFGSDLVSVGDLDKNGSNDLAVLLPASSQYPNSAIYIFFMDNEWTPSSNAPVVITGNSMPWMENSDSKHDCRGLGSASWQNGIGNLLVSCNAQSLSDASSKNILIKNLVLDSNGDILNSGVFSENKINYRHTYQTSSNPLSLKNHKNNLYAVSLAFSGPVYMGSMSSIRILSVMDADHSKNYSLEAGKSEAIVNLDSLFYKSGTSGFSAKTLYGLVQCGIQGVYLLCDGDENAIGSWSALELSSRSGCDAYRECKRKDTIFVYVRSSTESASTALRLPKSMVIPFFGQANFSDVKSLSYFKNPNLQNIGMNWNSSALKLSAAIADESGNLSVIPFSQKEGTDTLVFNLSISATTNSYPVYLHIADTSKILQNAIPANPGEDTVWNIAKKRYIALPRSSSSGNIYTYDIVQDMLGTYAEITGNYLHILKVDVADISIAYAENGQIKHRKITLMPEPNPLDASPIATVSQTQKLNAAYIKGGLQINGLEGDFEIRAYNFKGVEIQREKASAWGSTFVKLKQNCPQIVQIKTAKGKIYISIVNAD